MKCLQNSFAKDSLSFFFKRKKNAFQFRHFKAKTIPNYVAIWSQDLVQLKETTLVDLLMQGKRQVSLFA